MTCQRDQAVRLQLGQSDADRPAVLVGEPLEQFLAEVTRQTVRALLGHPASQALR